MYRLALRAPRIYATLHTFRYRFDLAYRLRYLRMWRVERDHLARDWAADIAAAEEMALAA